MTVDEHTFPQICGRSFNLWLILVWHIIWIIHNWLDDCSLAWSSFRSRVVQARFGATTFFSLSLDSRNNVLHNSLSNLHESFSNSPFRPNCYRRWDKKVQCFGLHDTSRHIRSLLLNLFQVSQAPQDISFSWPRLAQGVLCAIPGITARFVTDFPLFQITSIKVSTTSTL